MRMLAFTLLGVVVVWGAKHGSWGYPYNVCEWAKEAILCKSGRLQSPINLPGASSGVQAALDVAGYRSTSGTFKIKNNGHSIVVSRKKGALGPSIVIGGERFNLIQFHFHVGSEHRVQGRQKPMEVHFVHQFMHSGKAEYAVIGVFFQNSHYARPSPFLQWWINSMSPRSGGKRYTQKDYERTFASTLPFGRVGALRGASRKRYWAYQGSFTTPPCTEVVQWRVMHKIVRIPNSQYHKFRAAYHNNFRPPIPNLSHISGGNNNFGAKMRNPQLGSCVKHCRNKGWNYCRKGRKCGKGQGDCDNNAQCKRGLVCKSSVVGEKLSGSAVDCCQCPKSTGRGGWHACSRQCKCGHNQGDCDGNHHCKEGTSCRSSKAGEKLIGAAKDYCCNKLGGWHACNARNCKCHLGQGDCDNHKQCSGRLVCRSSVRGQKLSGAAKDFCCPRRDGKGARCHKNCKCAPGLECRGGRCRSARCHRGRNGGWAYCTNSCKCAKGEGDCDSHRQCARGLKCKSSRRGQHISGKAKDFCVEAEAEDNSEDLAEDGAVSAEPVDDSTQDTVASEDSVAELEDAAVEQVDAELTV